MAITDGSAGGEGSETDEEEVKTGEGDEVHGKLPEVAVELQIKLATSCDGGERR